MYLYYQSCICNRRELYTGKIYSMFSKQNNSYITRVVLKVLSIQILFCFIFTISFLFDSLENPIFASVSAFLVYYPQCRRPHNPNNVSYNTVLVNVVVFARISMYKRNGLALYKFEEILSEKESKKFFPHLNV